MADVTSFLRLGRASQVSGSDSANADSIAEKQSWLEAICSSRFTKPLLLREQHPLPHSKGCCRHCGREPTLRAARPRCRASDGGRCCAERRIWHGHERTLSECDKYGNSRSHGMCHWYQPTTYELSESPTGVGPGVSLGRALPSSRHRRSYREVAAPAAPTAKPVCRIPTAQSRSMLLQKTCVKQL